MSGIPRRLAAAEARLRPQLHTEPRGSIEYHYAAGGDGSRVVPCDLRDEHGPDCVMSVTPTEGGGRFMRIIEGLEAE